MITLTGRLVVPHVVTRPRYEPTVVIVPRSKIFPPKGKGKGFWAEFGSDFWYNQCGRKEAYYTFADADFVLIQVRNKFYKKGYVLETYECPFCDWYHIGHRKVSKPTT